MTDELYGLWGELSALRVAVEQALGIDLQQKENIYRGLHYEATGTGEETFILFQNWDLLDDEFMEEQFPEIPALLAVQQTQRGAGIERRLAAALTIRLLWRRVSE